MFKNAKIFILKYKQFLGSCFIFFVIVALLGLPHTRWGFLHDDFGDVWHAKIKGMKDIFSFFHEQGRTTFVQPSNYQVPEQSFLAVFYRPFASILYALQMLLFEFQPYGYFLTTIFFHALNAVLFFNLLLTFVDFYWALWAALFFGFHLSLWDWMGWIAGQNHVVNTTLLLAMLYLFKQYLDSKKISFYLGAITLYGVSLLYRETLIVLPFWLIISTPIYLKFIHNNSSKNFLITLYQSIKLTCYFWLFSIGYLILRMILYPFKATGAGLKVTANPIDFILSFKNRFFDTVTLVVDLANLSWIGSNNRLFKGSLLILFFAFTTWLFYKNSKKWVIAFCLLSMVIFMWPAILRYYSSRYLYKALPFVIGIFICLIKFSHWKTTERKKRFICLAAIMGFALIACNATLLVSHFKVRESELHQTALAFQELTNNPLANNRILCFIGLPYDIFPTGVAQAVWMHGINHDLPIYYDNTTFAWRTPNMHENKLQFTSVKNGIRLTSLDNKQLWFIFTNTCLALGDKIVHKRDQSTNKVYDMTYIFDQKHVYQKLLFVAWDYEQHRFKILDLNF